MEDWILTLENKPENNEIFKKYLFEYYTITNEKYEKYEEIMPFTININFNQYNLDKFSISSKKNCCFIEFSFIDDEIKLVSHLFKQLMYNTYDLYFFREIIIFIKCLNINFNNLIHQQNFEFNDLQDFSECVYT